MGSTSLFAKLAELQPRKIITVPNVNDGVLGDIVRWGEKDIPGFPARYAQEGSWSLEGRLSCPDFPTLAHQVSYLLDTELDQRETAALTQFLMVKLAEPSLPITQQVRAYRRIAK